MSDTRKELMRLMAESSTIGMTLAASIFIGFGIGYWLDKKVFDDRTTPWFMFIFLAIGIVAGFRNLYQLTRKKDQ